jgi:hypothetical protein
LVTLGIITETITTGGWILTTDAVTGILPQVNDFCASLPADAPVVIYCLDNVSFCCANSDGQISAINKLKDGNFHVVGEIVVVHEVTLAAAVTNLKWIILACGDRRVIIITPGPRYLTQPCCCDGSHCVHLLIPDAGLKMMADLARLHLFIQRRISSSANCLVVPACDLLAGKKGASLEEALAAFSTWGTVHGPTASYTRIALALVDGYFGKSAPAAPVVPKAASQQLKGRDLSLRPPMSPVPKPVNRFRLWPASALPSANPASAASRGAAPAVPDPDPGTPYRVAPRGAASTVAAAAATAGSER